MVTGSRSASSWVRLRPLRNDVPRSPETTWPIQRTYWTGGGSSSPYLARMAAMSSGLTLTSGPRMTVTGSPGTSRMSEKVTIDTPIRTGRRRTRRARRYFVTEVRSQKSEVRNQKSEISVGLPLDSLITLADRNFRHVATLQCRARVPPDRDFDDRHRPSDF